MYKIMTKLHTAAENIYAFYMVTNDNGEVIEYSVATPEEAAEQALEILKQVGYADLRIVDDKSYYMDLIYGVKPLPIVNKYTLTVKGPGEITIDPETMEDIEENATVQVKVKFATPVEAFHLIIDEKEYKTGMPKWITYQSLTETEGILTFSGITRDHVVEIEIDDHIYNI